MAKQSEKAHAFRALHLQPKTFVMPNPWDLGSARVLEGLGFPALATTSSGFALARGQFDGDPGREAVLAHSSQLAAVTKLPVSGDLENGFGDAPEIVAETIRMAAAAGLVGGSIEDYSGRAQRGLYEIAFAAERIRAAVEAARKLDFPFTLTARAENLFRGPKDLADTIRRLQAYQEAGADVLFAPGLRTRAEIASVLGEIDRPLSVLVGIGGFELSVPELQALGVRRVSLGGALLSVAYGALINAGRELMTSGGLGFMAETERARDLRALLGQG